jgi:hypothetical protein
MLRVIRCLPSTDGCSRCDGRRLISLVWGFPCQVLDVGAALFDAGSRAVADRPPRVRRQRPVDGLRSGKSADRQRTERSPPSGAIPRAATLYSVGSAGDPDHEAVIRFGSRAPRRRTHSQDGVEAMAYLGSPSPRIVVGSPLATARSGSERLCFGSFCCGSFCCGCGSVWSRLWSARPVRPRVAAQRPRGPRLS